MSFFDSEIVQGEMKEINRLQQAVYSKVFAFAQMGKSEKLKHVEMLEELLKKQQVLYTRLSLSDDPIKDEDIAKVTRSLVQIPMVGGTIAFGYNKPTCDLQLTQKQAVQVAMGIFKNWNELGQRKQNDSV